MEVVEVLLDLRSSLDADEDESISMDGWMRAFCYALFYLIIFLSVYVFVGMEKGKKGKKQKREREGERGRRC